jgi:general secretion pathway protein B
MSFILDALKKSEAERSREAGPALISMRIVPPRRRMPLWVIVLTVILFANLAVLAFMLLRTPAGPAAPAASASPAPAPPAAAAPAAAPANVLPPPVLLPEAAPPRESPPMALAPPANARPVPTQAPPTPAARSDEAQLPEATDLRLAGITLPELRLSLHVYDSNPGRRYVLLNSRQLREGEGTGDGLVLERVTPTGVVLSFNGQRFRLEAGQ